MLLIVRSLVRMNRIGAETNSLCLIGVLLGCALVSLVPAAAHAQTELIHPPEPLIRDPGGYPFHTPTHSPLEPLIRLGIVHVSRDTASGTVLLPDLGDRLSFWLHRAPAGDFELAGAVAGGVFSRFDLEGSDNEFIEAHYRVGFQLRARYRGLAARAELYHVSSHLGDEFLTRTGREPVSTSREGLELLIQGSPLSGLVVYGGPGVLIRSTEDFDSPSVRAGGMWSPGKENQSFAPYASGEIFAWSELDWDPVASLEAGIRFGRRARLGFTYGRGPSRAEQFFRENEELLGVAFSFLR